MSITNEPDRVIMRGEWATEVIYDVTFSGTENLEAFQAEFEIVSGDHQAGEDYYQGLAFMALIRRKSDGRLFGYELWRPLANHADDLDVEANGEEHGIEYEWDEDGNAIGGLAYVWLPVETFAITGYRIAEASQ